MKPDKLPYIDNTVKIQLFLIVVLLGFISAPTLLSFFGATPHQSPSVNQTPKLSIQTASSTQNTTVIPPPYGQSFTALPLRAKSIYVWDIQEKKVLFARNEHASLPLASLTKMMMALVASEILDENSPITIDQDDLMEEGDSMLAVGEKWTLKDILKFTLVSSSNDGASAIAGVAGARLLGQADIGRPIGKDKFIAKMNDKANLLGLEKTIFHNEHGLDLNESESGAYGTARDMAVLFENIYRTHPELFESTEQSKLTIRSSSNISHRVLNTNIDAGKIAGLVGSKTGFTDLAGGNLVVIVDIGINHPVIISVLGSTMSERFTDVEKLIQATITDITASDSPLVSP